MQAANYVPVTDLALITADDVALLPFINGLDSSTLYPNRNIINLIAEEEALFTIFDNLTIK